MNVGPARLNVLSRQSRHMLLWTNRKDLAAASYDCRKKRPSGIVDRFLTGQFSPTVVSAYRPRTETSTKGVVN